MPVLSHDLAVAVLAAGGGSRLGGGKLLLPWRGKALVLHTLAAAASLERARAIIVVTGHEAEQLRLAIREGYDSSLPLPHLVENPHWREGLSTSLRSAVTTILAMPELGDICGLMLLLGDQPRIHSETLALLARRHAEKYAEDAAHRATAPTYGGRRGNPVILSPALFPSVLHLHGDVGARAILDQLGDALQLVPVNDPGVLADVDLPEEYAALLESDETFL